MRKLAVKPIILSWKKNTNFAMELSGLVVNPNYPHMGASLDGVMKCDCCGLGVLEMSVQLQKTQDN